MKIKEPHIIVGIIAIATVVVFVTHETHRLGPDSIYPPNQIVGVVNSSITQANIGQNICNPKWSTKSIRPSASYTIALKKKQFAEYNYQDTNTKDFEEDHFISLELGGNPTDPLNLWPESYTTQVNGEIVGAKQKDSVENLLHTKICSGEITLKQAQDLITKDWYAVYVSEIQKKNLPISTVDSSDE